MEYKINKLSQTKVEIIFSFPASEFMPMLDKELYDVQRHKTLKGFRPGKAPLSLVKRYFERAALENIAENLTHTKFDDVIKKEGLTTYGKEHLRHFEIVDGKQLDIWVECEVSPEFDIKPFDTYTFEKNIYKVEDADVQTKLEALSKEYGTWESTSDASAFDDLLIVDIQDIDESGSMTIGGKKEGVYIHLSEKGENAGIADQLVGLKVGDEKILSHKHHHENEKTDHTAFHRYSIKEVKRLRPLDINDDLAKQITNNKLQTVEELHKQVWKTCEEQSRLKTAVGFSEHIISTMLKDHSFEVPDSLLRTKEAIEFSETKAILESRGISLDNILNKELEDNIKRKAFRNASWSVFFNKVAKDMSIDISSDELKEFYDDAAKKLNVPYSAFEKNDGFSNYVAHMACETILSRKVIDIIVSKSSVQEKIVSLSQTHENELGEPV